MGPKLLFAWCWMMFLFSEIGYGQTIALFRAVDEGKGMVIDKEYNRTLNYDVADTIISGQHIRRAKVTADLAGRPVIDVSLNEEGARLFAVATKLSVGKPLLIMYGSRLLAAPTVSSEITGGQLQISGAFNMTEAITIAEQLNDKTRPVLVKDELNDAVTELDAAFVKGDHKVLDSLLHDDLLMGHSNAYFQTKEEVVNDLRRSKIIYQNIEQLGVQNINEQGEFVRMNRSVKVKGKYMGTDFDMKLALMEIWSDTDNGMRLWSRQAVKINE